MNDAELMKNHILKVLENKRENRPVKSNRASELGHPCLRYLVLIRANWKDRELPSVELQSIFEEGKLQHDAFKNWVSAEGFSVIQNESAFDDPRYDITGTIDGKIKLGEMPKHLPYEFKSLSTYTYAGIDCIDDMKRHKYHYIRKYPVQLNLYLFLTEMESGFFFLKNKQAGFHAMKIFEMPLDYALAEEAIQKAERVNAHIKAGALPDFLEEVEICQECQMRFVCQPPLKRSDMDVETDPIINEKLDRLMSLKETIAEYEALNREVKKRIEGRNILIGNWLCQGKWVERKAYQVEAVKYWQSKIIKAE